MQSILFQAHLHTCTEKIPVMAFFKFRALNMELTFQENKSI